MNGREDWKSRCLRPSAETPPAPVSLELAGGALVLVLRLHLEELERLAESFQRLHGLGAPHPENAP